MITQDNYSIEIYSATTGDSAELGLLDGIYTWTVGGDILADKGISNLKRSFDLRTGGGIAQEPTSKATLMSGKYAIILGTSPIVGKRFTVLNNDVAEYTGVVTSVDPKGFENVINLTVESKTREVTLPYNSSAIGDVEINGITTGESGYIQTLDEASAMRCDSVADATTYYQIGIKGGTATNVSEINRIIDEIDVRLSEGQNVYYEGEFGLYRLVVRLGSGSGGVFPYRLGDGIDFSLLNDEPDEYGSILWSTEVYNKGLDGDIIVNGKTIDDINDNILPYNEGQKVEASDGYVWRSLLSGTDYVTIQDDGGLTQLMSGHLMQYISNGVYARNYIGTVTVISGIDSGANITDWDANTSTVAEITYNPAPSGPACAGAVKLSMNGYKFGADKLYAIVDYELTKPVGITFPATAMQMLVGVTSYEAGNGTPIYDTVVHSTQQPFEATISTPYAWNSGPSEYGTNDQRDFYNPSVLDQGSEIGSYVLDITDALLTAGADTFYDGVTIHIGVGFSLSGGGAHTTSAVEIRQINLVEGYDIGREGIKDNQVRVDNSAINGTIPLAYADVVKRQNFFGINSTPPVTGWGTEKTETDGNANNIDVNYLSTDIPEGKLEGIYDTAVTTTTLKKEIARSVPAVSFYDKDGVETLLEVGRFVENTNEIAYTDVVGEVKVKSYSGSDIQPTLLFEFGTDKKILHITNVEQATYSSAYVKDEIGLSEQQKTLLWESGKLLYDHHGTTTNQAVRKYPLVNYGDDAYRVATGIYANMGAVGGVYYDRKTVSFSTKKSVKHDLGADVSIQFPMVKGFGVVSSVEPGVYRGTNAYIVDMIEAETIAFVGDILITGAQVDDVLINGIQTDNILVDGA